MEKETPSPYCRNSLHRPTIVTFHPDIYNLVFQISFARKMNSIWSNTSIVQYAHRQGQGTRKSLHCGHQCCLEIPADKIKRKTNHFKYQTRFVLILPGLTMANDENNKNRRRVIARNYHSVPLGDFTLEKFRSD